MAKADLQLTFPPFRPRLPWLGPDLQTLRNTLRGSRVQLSPAETIEFSVDDSGDRLMGRLHRPAQAAARPLVILLHGLTGSEESVYIRETAHRLTGRGFPVLRLNLRGAGPSRALCRQQYHAGRTADLAAVIQRLPPADTMHGVAAVGFSLGGAMLLKHLSEAGADSGLVRAVTVCAPIDLIACSRAMHSLRNRPYHAYMLGEMKREFLATPDLPPERAAQARRLTRIVDFDDQIVAPANGFASAEDYQTRCSPVSAIGRIRTPTLAIHAADDPWIPADAYHAADWSGGAARMLLARRGGHLGFHGRGGTWHDECLLTFLEAV